MSSTAVKSRAGRRTLELPEFLADLLAQHIAARGIRVDQPEELLFVAPGGGPVRATNFRKRSVEVSGFEPPTSTLRKRVRASS